MRTRKIPVMRMSRSTRRAVVLAVLVWLGVGRVLETRRLDEALPESGTQPRGGRLDTARMVDDLRVLASSRFEGRATDAPGGALASVFVATRFRELGLTPFGGQYEQPFQFLHHSVRAIWRQNRPFSRTFTQARNIVGYVPGRTRPDEFVVVSAHFDHLGVYRREVYAGADDNASGTAALLALAAWVQAHPLDRTVVFAAFDAEELGLRGARAFVSALPFPKERLRLDLNIDMIGRADFGRVFVSGVRYHPDLLLPIVEHAARNSAVSVHIGHDRPVLLTGLIDNWTMASDHGAFHEAAIPFLYFGVEDHTDVHRPTDLAERIDPQFYGGVAETVLSALIAAGDEG